MKRILILGNCVAGLYKFRKELIKGLIDEGHDIYFSTPNNSQFFVEKLKEMGAEFIETSIDRRGVNPIKDASLFLNYLRMISKIKPDVMLIYTIKPNIYGSFAAQILDVDYINNITGLGTSFQMDNLLVKVLKQMYRLSFKKSKCVLFQNQENMNFFLKNRIIEGKKVELLPGSGVNIDEFHPMLKTKKKYSPVFLFVGRIMKDKGIKEYLEAAKAIKEEGYKAEFHILGPWEEKEWKVKVNEYEEKGYVRYLGFSNDVREYIRECDCLVNPSYHEGMSNVLLEAGAMGKLLLGSDISGIKEIISNKSHLFKKENILDLKNKIKEILQMDELKIKEIVGTQREYIREHFDRNLIVKKYIEKLRS